MTKSRRNLGIWGEKKASEYLLGRGYTLCERNVRTAYGEIDIVARKDGVTYFVEVKTRRTQTFGFPEESITPMKRDHLVNSAQAYLLDHPKLDGKWQIDVIAIQHLDPGPPKIIHFKNAISD